MTEVEQAATTRTLAATISQPRPRVSTPTGSPTDGSVEAPTVLAVHGFAQNRNCWGPLATHLAESCQLIRVDAPGHGGSLRHATASLREAGTLIVDTAPRTAPVVLVGYSMGARMCLTAAVEHPDRVAGLVLIGGTAGLDSEQQRRKRRAEDEERAVQLMTDGLDRFLTTWLAMDMFAGLPEWARFDRERATNSAEGLAASLRHAGTGSMPPLWDRLGELRVPVLCLSGETDSRYGALADRIAGAAPSALARSVPGAGHAAHLENPAATIAEIARWFDVQADSR